MRDFFRCTFSKFGPWQYVFGLIFLAATVAFIINEASAHKFVEGHPRATSALVLLALYTTAMFVPLVKLANEDGMHSLHYLTTWIVFSLGFLGYCLYFFLFVRFGTDADRLLNLPPALIALTGALYGLYVNYQVNLKHQRTKAAFDLIMTTRTSPQFAKNLDSYRAVFPAGSRIPKADKVFLFTEEGESPVQRTTENAQKYDAIAGLTGC